VSGAYVESVCVSAIAWQVSTEAHKLVCAPMTAKATPGQPCGPVDAHGCPREPHEYHVVGQP
jgi:hypothetical protein